MAEQTLVQARVDKELKQEVTEIYEALGMDIPTAIRMFFVRSKMVRGIPFDTTLPKGVVTRTEALSALDDMFKQAEAVPEMTLDEINAEIADVNLHRSFASAGQSTQMIIGATGETDFELIRTTQNLYQAFDLKRVFYSGYIPVNEDDALPQLGTPVPLLREHRLYQADWLMRYYGFYADELLSEKNPFFDDRLDPKCFWALNHLEKFPIEVNTASAENLLKVPGIGPTGVKKILSARRYGSVNFEMLKKMHIVLKRAQYFITCNGRMLHRIPIEERFIRNQLTDLEKTNVMQIEGSEVSYRQMNLFTDFHV